MEPSAFAEAVIAAVDTSDGVTLAQLFGNNTPLFKKLTPKLKSLPSVRILPALRRCSGYLKDPWETCCSTHLAVLQHLIHGSSEGGLRPSSFVKRNQTLSAVDINACAHHLKLAFDQQIQLVSAVIRWFQGLTPGSWALPMLLATLHDLLILAKRLDNAEYAVFLQSQTGLSSQAKTAALSQKRLEEAARQLNKAFTACAGDRMSEPHQSRRLGTYSVVNLIFKTYFKLKSIPLCRNIIRALAASGCPPLEKFPIGDQVNFRYYTGVLAFLDEDYQRAEEDLHYAFVNCQSSARQNTELILQYLIPLRLMHGCLPGDIIYAEFPKLAALYGRFTTAFQMGDVRSYDRALVHTQIERTLILKGVYIAMERAREGCLRTLFRRVWLAQGRTTRLPLQLLHSAISWVGLDVTIEEAEWYAATLIHKGYLKGYISHERQMLVVSAKDAFPPLSSVIQRTD